MIRAATSQNGMAHRPATRLLSSALVVVFLLTQSWVVCFANCLQHDHVAMAHRHHHAASCHHENVVQKDLTSPVPADAMLPSRVAPPAPARSGGAVAIESSTTPYTHLIPATDPPPPRLA